MLFDKLLYMGRHSGSHEILVTVLGYEKNCCNFQKVVRKVQDEVLEEERRLVARERQR